MNYIGMIFSFFIPGAVIGGMVVAVFVEWRQKMRTRKQTIPWWMRKVGE